MAIDNDDTLRQWTTDRLAAIGPVGSNEMWNPDTDGAFAALVARRRARLRRGARWTRVVVAFGMVCAGLSAFSSTRAFAARCIQACVGVSARAGHLFDAPPPARSMAPDAYAPAVGAEAPDFSLDDAAGRPLRLSALRGHVVALNFWATWCSPCRTEIPWFADFQARFSGRGLVVVGVSLDDDGWTSVRPYLAVKHVNYPVVIGTDAVSRAYGDVDALPLTVLVGKTGVVEWSHAGLIDRDEADAEILSLIGRGDAAN